MTIWEKLCVYTIVTWCNIWAMVTHTQNLCSAFTYPGAHTQQWTHTLPEQWAAIHTAAVPGEQYLAQGHLSRGIEGEESAVHSLPPRQFLPVRDLNPQPFDYASDSLTIRPRLPHIQKHIVEYTYIFKKVFESLKFWIFLKTFLLVIYKIKEAVIRQTYIMYNSKSIT